MPDISVLTTYTNTASEETPTTASVSPTASRRIIVIAAHFRSSDYNAAIDSITATFNTEGGFTIHEERSRYESTPDDEVGIVIASAVTTSSPGSGTVTVDIAESAAPPRWIITVLEASDDLDLTTALAQAVVSDFGTASSESVSLGSAPDSGNLLIAALARTPSSGITKDADYTQVINVESDGADGSNVRMQVQKRTGTTDATAAWSLDATPDVNVFLIAEFQVAAAGDTITLSHAASSTASHALSVAPGAVTVTLGNAASVTSAYGLSVVPGAITVTLGHSTSATTAYSLDVAVGAVQVTLGHSTSLTAGYGLDVVPGAVTVALGHATSATTGYALDIVPGAVTISLGYSASATTAYALDVIEVTGDVATLSYAGSATTAYALDVVVSAVAVTLGHAATSTAAYGLEIVPGAVAVALGHSPSATSAHALNVLPGAVTVTLAAASSVTSTYPLDVQVGPVELTLNYSASTTTPHPLSVVGGAAVVALGYKSSVTIGYALDVESLPRFGSGSPTLSLLVTGTPTLTPLITGDPQLS